MDGYSRPDYLGQSVIRSDCSHMLQCRYGEKRDNLQVRTSYSPAQRISLDEAMCNTIDARHLAMISFISATVQTNRNRANPRESDLNHTLACGVAFCFVSAARRDRTLARAHGRRVRSRNVGGAAQSSAEAVGSFPQLSPHG